MPLLFALGIHDALHRVQAKLGDGAYLCVFLDDIYVICDPDRVREIYDMLSAELDDHAEIQLNTGKTRV